MRRTLLAAALVVVLAPTLGRAADADTERDIARLSRQAIDARLKADTAALDALLADDYVGISPSGEVGSKAEALKRLKDGTLHFDTIEPSEVRVRVYGDAAVLTDRGHVKVTNRGRADTLSVRVTEVYAKQGGTWRCVSAQVTRIAEPPRGSR
jgi:ketosteroid isomerase-like protein